MARPRSLADCTVTEVTKSPGIPLLGSLPIIGKLFSFNSDTKPA